EELRRRRRGNRGFRHAGAEVGSHSVAHAEGVGDRGARRGIQGDDQHAHCAASTRAAAAAPNLSGTESHRSIGCAPRPPPAVRPAAAGVDTNTATLPPNTAGSSRTVVSRHRPAYTVGTLFQLALVPTPFIAV